MALNLSDERCFNKISFHLIKTLDKEQVYDFVNADKLVKKQLVFGGLKRCFGIRYLHLKIERRIKQHGTICYHLLGKESLNTQLEPAAVVQMFSMRLTMMVMMPTRLLISAQQKTSERLEQHALEHNGLHQSSSLLAALEGQRAPTFLLFNVGHKR